MRTLKPIVAATLFVVLFAVVMIACEDNGVIPPPESTLSVTANPATVVIDQLAGDTEGTSTIIAQIFDANGFPASGIDVLFTSTGGAMASNPAGQDPVTIETDGNGRAVDVLTLTLADPASVDVTAVAGSLAGSVTVSKNVAAGNQQPTARVAAQPSPPNEQRKTVPVTFDGSGSSDPDGQISCFKWTVTSSEPTSDEVIQGASRSSFTRTYINEQLLTVKLQVSDDLDPSFCPDCLGTAATCGAADSFFSPFDDNLQYSIVCDVTEPLVSAGTDQTVQLIGGSAIVKLQGSAEDPESPTLSYSWTCGNGSSGVPDPDDPANELKRQCTYTSSNTTPGYTVRLTVTNECNMSAFDEATVRVTPGT